MKCDKDYRINWFHQIFLQEPFHIQPQVECLPLARQHLSALDLLELFNALLVGKMLKIF